MSLRLDATVVPLIENVQGVATHPEDDLVLAAAVSAQAAFLVTGDAQLQRLQTFQATAIVSPQGFLSILANDERI